MAFPRKLVFALPPDLKGQLWVACGVPVGLAILARAMHELEAAIGRRHELITDLDAKIGAKRAELGLLLVAKPAGPPPTCPDCGLQRSPNFVKGESGWALHDPGCPSAPAHSPGCMLDADHEGGCSGADAQPTVHANGTAPEPAAAPGA